MAVVVGADPVDHALDELARLAERPSPIDLFDRMIIASAIVALWEKVAEHALATNDAPLLIVATREWLHARDAFRSLDPP